MEYYDIFVCKCCGVKFKQKGKMSRKVEVIVRELNTFSKYQFMFSVHQCDINTKGIAELVGIEQLTK